MDNDKDLLVLEKNNKTKWFLIIFLILLLGGGIAFYYFKYFNNPVYVISKGLSKVYESYDNVMDIDENKPYRVSGNLKLGIDSSDQEMQEIYDVVNNIDLLYNINLSEKDELYNIEIDSKYLDSKLFNGKIISNKDKVYLYLEDLYDKYLYVETEEVSKNELVEDLNEEDYANILGGLQTAFTESFNDNDFKREKTTITDDGKKISVYKNYLVIDNTNYKRIFKNVLTKLRDDEKFIASFNKALEEKNAKDMLEEELNALLSSEFDGKIEFVVYSKGYTNKFVKLSVNIYEMDQVYNVDVDCDKITINQGDAKDDLMTVVIDVETNNWQVSITMADQLDLGLEKITMKFGMLFSNINSVEKIDESKAINIEKLTDDELMGIYQKILQNEGFNRLIEDFSLGMGSDLGISA